MSSVPQRKETLRIVTPVIAMPAESDLFLDSVRRSVGRAALFLLGLWLIDQAVLRLGDRLAASPYWNDNMMAHLAQPADWDMAILGTCRAFFLPTPALQQTLGKRILNVGRRGSRLASMAFQLNVARHGAAGKYLVLVLDYFVLEQTPAQARDEMVDFSLWEARLTDDERRAMNERIGISVGGFFRQHSGLVKYQGQGANLRQAALRWLRRQPAPLVAAHTGRDTFTPYLDLTMKVTDEVKRAQIRQPTRTEFASRWLADMIRDAKAAGMKPIVILPPLHRWLTTPAVDADLRDHVGAIAATYQVPVLNYLDANGPWSARDEWWVDPGHLNAKGVEDFSKRLMEDLKGLVP